MLSLNSHFWQKVYRELADCPSKKEFFFGKGVSVTKKSCWGLLVGLVFFSWLRKLADTPVSRALLARRWAPEAAMILRILRLLQPIFAPGMQVQCRDTQRWGGYHG